MIFIFVTECNPHKYTQTQSQALFRHFIGYYKKKPSHNKSFLNTAAQERVEIVHIFHKNHPSGYLLLVPHKKKTSVT